MKKGADPGPWLPGRSDDVRRLDDLEVMPLEQLFRLEKSKTRQLSFDEEQQILFDPSTSSKARNENHMNREAYEFIRENELYNVEGQEALFLRASHAFEQAAAQGRAVDASEYTVSFPAGAKEVKAQWRPITEQEKDSYHWHGFVDGSGQQTVYGLTALHITTKDLPNWFWATFEHVDNPKRPQAEPWMLASRDRAAGPDGFPKGLGIEGTRWSHYRLRGTQTAFVDGAGQPTLLANSEIESGFQYTSSCITCHARAAIGAPSKLPSGDRVSIFEKSYPHGDVIDTIGSTGSPNPEWFIRTTFDSDVAGRLDYLQLDFVWSMMRAKRKGP